MPANKNKKVSARRAAKSQPRVLVVPDGTKVNAPKGTLVLRKLNGRHKRVSFE